MNNKQHTLIGIGLSLGLLLFAGLIEYIAPSQFVHIQSDVTSSTSAQNLTLQNGTFESLTGWTATTEAARLITVGNDSYATFSKGTNLNGIGTLTQDIPGINRNTTYALRGKIRSIPVLPTTNLLTNPSFEDTGKGWTACSLVTPQTSTTYKNSDTQSLSATCIEQTFAIPDVKPGSEYTASIATMTGTGSTVVNTTITLETSIVSSTGDIIRTLPTSSDTLTSPNVWKTITSNALTLSEQGNQYVKLRITATDPTYFDTARFLLTKGSPEDIAISFWDVGTYPPVLLTQRTLHNTDLPQNTYEWTEDLYLLPSLPVSSSQVRFQLKLETNASLSYFTLNDFEFVELPRTSSNNPLFNPQFLVDDTNTLATYGDAIANNTLPNGWSFKGDGSFTITNQWSGTGAYLTASSGSGSSFTPAMIEQYIPTAPVQGSWYIGEVEVETGSGSTINTALWIRHNPNTYLLEEQAIQKTLLPMSRYRLQTRPLEIRKNDISLAPDATSEMKKQLMGIAFSLDTPNTSVHMLSSSILLCSKTSDEVQCKRLYPAPISNSNTNNNSNGNSNTNSTNVNKNANTNNVNINTNTTNTNLNLNRNTNTIIPNANTNTQTGSKISTDYTAQSFTGTEVIRDTDTPTTSNNQNATFKPSAGAQTCPPTCPPSLSSFPDVPDSHFAWNAIRYLAQRGIMTGNGDGSFTPDQLVNRAEFAKIITRAFQIKKPSSAQTLSFQDMSSADWYYTFANTLVQQGIIQGYNGGTFFAGERAINRAESAKIIALAAGETEKTLDESFMAWRAEHPTYTYVFFRDVPVTAWFAKYVYYTAQNSFITGRITNKTTLFMPNGKVTRGEAAVMLSRVIFSKQITYPVAQDRSTGLIRVQFDE